MVNREMCAVSDPGGVGWGIAEVPEVTVGRFDAEHAKGVGSDGGSSLIRGLSSTAGVKAGAIRKKRVLTDVEDDGARFEEIVVCPVKPFGGHQ